MSEVAESWNNIDENMASTSISETKFSSFNVDAAEYVPTFDTTTSNNNDEKKSLKSSETPQITVETVNVIFIGHVDSGKSTIGGQILYLTGMVDKRTLEKYEREAKEKNRETWYLSWSLDTSSEEREKGKTVEVGKASFNTEHKKFILLDAPGHKGFVPNMIGGTAQADIAVLVISARKGEFETGFDKGGQTREHAMLAKTSGVRFLIVLINKMDDPTVNWAQERFNEIEAKLTPFLKKVGFKTNEMYVIPCSGFNGTNIKNKVDSSLCSWYSGKSLLDFLDKMPPFLRDPNSPLRMFISDKFKDMGTVTFCKVESGYCSKGDSLVIMPLKKIIKAISIQSFEEIELNSAFPGDNVRIKLANIEEDEIFTGNVLCHISNPCNFSTLFDAQLVIQECKSIICSGFSAILHLHHVTTEVQLKKIWHLIDKKTGQKSQVNPRFVKNEQVCVVRLETAIPVCMEEFSFFPPMGRFTLRDEGKTVAIGKILKVINTNTLNNDNIQTA